MQWQESVVVNPGPGGNVVSLCKADAGRVLLAFSSSAAFNTRFTTATIPATSQGFTIPPQMPYVVMPIREWGIFIQQDWFSVNGSGLAETITVFELLADSVVNVDDETFGARPAGLTRKGAARATAFPASLFPSNLSPLDRLRARIKGELWNLSRKPS